MNQYFNRRIASQSLGFLNIICLVLHSIFLYYFYALGIQLMVYVNIVSVAMYALSLFFWAKMKSKVFYYVVSVEILVHMVLATICVGPNAGFHWTLLFLPAFFFFADFFSLEIRGKTMHGLLGSILNYSGYIFAEWYLHNYGYLYEIPAEVAFVTRMCMSTIIFALAVFLLRTLTKYTYLTESKLHQRATVDALTGLYNRFDVMEQLDNYQQRDELEGFWVAMLDVDDFKEINDTYGHNMGDYVLMNVAGVLRKHLSDDVVGCRWGGDEFLLYGKPMKNEEAVVSFLEEVSQEVAGLTFEMLGEKTSLHITMGVAFFHKDDNVRDWISMADKKLHAGKYSGKDCVMS